MDLQKIAAQANAATGQRAEGAKEGAGVFASPFADMIRFPLIAASDLLGSKDGKGAQLDQVAESQNRADKPDYQRSDNDADRQVNTRDDARDDNVRAEKPDNGHADDDAPKTDNSRNGSDADRETADAQDDQAPQQANNDEGNEPENVEAQTDTDETGTGTEVDQVADDAATPGQTSEGAANTNNHVEPALAGLIAAAQNAQFDGAPKDAAQAVSTVAASANLTKVTNTGPVAEKDANTGPATGAGNTTTDGEQAKQAQQAQSVLDRVGAQTASKSGDIAKVSAEQPLVGQQAKALADSLKSDKPVKIQVNVENRAGTTVSQTSQSLNANGVVAQETGDAQNPRANGPRGNAANAPQQVAQARVDGTAVTPGQTQALNQLAQGTANTAAEGGVNRATMQVSNAGPQASHGGGDGVNATPSGGTVTGQQAANIQRAQQPQAARAPEQARPLAHQISVNISKAVSQGLDRITIQLRPDNLGRVEVKLEVTQNGRVNATIIADRPEALDLLRNDSRNLERALQDAGLNTQSGDLSFNLRDQQENPDGSRSENRIAGGGDSAEDGNLEAELATRILNGELSDIISDTRIDIRA